MGVFSQKKAQMIGQVCLAALMFPGCIAVHLPQAFQPYVTKPAQSRSRISHCRAIIILGAELFNGNWC
jgi:hypothetical protein